MVSEAQDWADDQFYDVVETLTVGGEVAVAKATLKKVAGVFKGEPQAEEAKGGLEAVAAFAKIGKLEGERATKARGAAGVKYAGTRWFALFAAKK